MITKLVVTGLVLGIALLALSAAGAIVLWLGWLGVAIDVIAAAGILAAYLVWIGPWQHRWGAADEEVRRTMPGDEVIPHSASTTRAITVAAPPEEVWPWLVQIGFGRAGWYSYDWIDNDGRPSADRIVLQFQDLAVGDQLPMVPGMGPRVREIAPPRYLLSGDEILGTWCLGLYRSTEGTRLVSRWRVGWRITPATLFWILIVDPGAFIMERRMLLGIKARAELHHSRRTEPATWAA
jgi:hypothetical protein